jgi:hypothetical protein
VRIYVESPILDARKEWLSQSGCTKMATLQHTGDPGANGRVLQCRLQN